MNGKDLLKLLLLNYGFKNIEISTYKGDFNYIGYDVWAENKDFQYKAVDCEGLMFHIYQITDFMLKNNIEPVITNRCNQSIKNFLDDKVRIERA